MPQLPPELAAALLTARPIADIAREMGKTQEALEKQIRRATSCRSNQLRTGEPPKPGGRPLGRFTRQLALRLTPEELGLFEKALAQGYALGGDTDGRALLAFVAHALQQTSQAKDGPVG